MSTRRERAKESTAKLNKQLAALNVEAQKVQTNQPKEKFADFMIDVAKYVFTGVIITSLFNDVTDKTMLYVVGICIVGIALWIGLLLTNKRKDK